MPPRPMQRMPLPSPMTQRLTQVTLPREPP